MTDSYLIPTVSIIAPVYNMSRYLPEFIESVLAQNFSNFELILIDDGSTDSSYEICKNYARKDSRVTVIHQNNRGVSVARNTGIERAAGEWISFVDPDDCVSSDFLEKMLLDCGKDSDIDLVQCYTKRFDDKGNIYPYKKVYDKNSLLNGKDWLYNAEYYFARSVILPRSVLYRAAIIKENIIRFDSRYAVCEDCDFVFRFAKFMKKGYIDVAELYFYRQQAESLTHTKGISKSQFSAILFYRNYVSENGITDNGIKTGFLFGELKVYLRLIFQELILACSDSHYKSNLAGRIDSVKQSLIDLYVQTDIELFCANPISFLQKKSRNLSKQINWHLQIKGKYHLLAVFISSCNVSLLKFFIKVFLKVRRPHV